MKPRCSMLADASCATIVLVSRPQRAALARGGADFGRTRALDIGNQFLVINGVFHATDRTDDLALAMERRGQRAFQRRICNCWQPAGIRQSAAPMERSWHRRTAGAA